MNNFAGLHPCVLGLDPGIKNYGVCWVDRQGVYHGETNTGILDLAEFEEYYHWVTDKINELNPDCVVIERYTFRGMQSKNAEKCNLAIGVVMTVCLQRGIPCVAVTASQWKNWRKKATLSSKYLDFQLDNRNSVHSKDAGCMIEYLLQSWARKIIKKSKWHNTYEIGSDCETKDITGYTYDNHDVQRLRELIEGLDILKGK